MLTGAAHAGRHSLTLPLPLTRTRADLRWPGGRSPMWASRVTLLIQKGSRPSVFTGMCTRRSHRSRSVTQGHRGNHVARTRATARRTVMKESRKCRSGRVAVRTVVTMRRFPRGSFSGRGGKSLERSATINAKQTSTMDTWWFQPRKERPRSDPAQALPWRPRTPVRCATAA